MFQFHLIFSLYIGFLFFVKSEFNGIKYLRKVVLKGSTETIQSIDLSKYLGLWYQVYGAPTNMLFQGYGKCITAEYGLLEDGNVSVLNSQLNFKNELEQISGYAYYKNVSEPGKLTVHLDGTPVDAPYWIVSLGEIINEEYQYSIVTSPSGISLWVLVRDIDFYLKNYDNEVKNFLAEYDYRYMTIKQDETC